MRVGDELTNYLGNYGFNVNHNKDFHDYPAYTGSYSRSLKTVQNTPPPPLGRYASQDLRSLSGAEKSQKANTR